MKTQKEIKAAMKSLQKFIGAAQWGCLSELLKGEESAFFGEELCRLAARVEAMPTSYQTDGQGDAAKVWLHYFTSGADFYITEKDSETSDEPGQHQAFGLADLGHGAELGYISIVEILASGAELDFYFTPRTLAEVRLEKHTKAHKPTNRERFEMELMELLESIKDKARRQFDYDEKTNIPAGILQPCETIKHALDHGIVAALSARADYGIEPIIELAGDMLEDVNAHSEAAQVRAMLEPVTA